MCSINKDEEEDLSESSCFICSTPMPNRQKLKTHLLLKHPKLNLCLFCVQAKGWSDTFATQSSYNDHYWECHEGTIEVREKQRRQAIKEKKQQRQEYLEKRKEAIKLGLPLPKRPNRRLVCEHCGPKAIEFELGNDYDRHLISIHGYDYCKLCNTMGTPLSVRMHAATAHENRVCVICCSLSPIFDTEDNFRKHFKAKHPIGDNKNFIPCTDCKSGSSFPSCSEFADHLREHHDKEAMKPLKAMHRRRVASNPQPSRSCEADSSSDLELPALQKITGIVNESGEDCFSISVLHLLAQTDLVKIEVKEGHENCQEPYCLLGSLFQQYCPAGRKRVHPVSPKIITGHYEAFGLDVTNLSSMDCGDFLQGCLRTVCESKDNPSEDYKNLFLISLEWKFECLGCKRFMVTRFKDYVLKVDGSKESSFNDLLTGFLLSKKCLICGTLCPVKPVVKSVGKYIFVEINRSISSEEDPNSKDLCLYSLRLERSYNIFGFKYVFFGTINYNLEFEEGGHYVTKLFPSSAECTKVHEVDVKTVRNKPDFDVDTVIVALKKVDMTGRDTNIEMKTGN